MWIRRLRLVLWRFRAVAELRQPSAGVRAPPGEKRRYCVSLVAMVRAEDVSAHGGPGEGRSVVA
jgi:hypothetical protein